MKTDSQNVQQLLLLPSAVAEPADCSLATILKRPTFLRALHLAQEVSGLEDKQIYDVIDIHPSHYTKMKSRAAHFPTDERLLNFMNVTNSDIPLIWLAEKRGYDWSTIRRHQSCLEKQLEQARAALADKDREIAERDRFIDRVISTRAR